LAAGPKACILLSTKYKDNISNTTIDLYDRTTGFNLQLGFRVGWETAIANLGYFFIEGGYHTGLIDMSLISSAKIKEGEIVPLGIGFRMNFPQPNKNVS